MCENITSLRVAIVGSRSITAVNLEKYLPPNCTLIVSGGAKGVDSIAEAHAKAHSIDALIFLPDYKTYGKRAPLIRNKLIVDSADLVLAFWDGKSTGTIHTIKYAKERGVPYKLYVPLT